MYCIYGESRSSLLLESSDSMMPVAKNHDRYVFLNFSELLISLQNQRMACNNHGMIAAISAVCDDEKRVLHSVLESIMSPGTHLMIELRTKLFMVLLLDHQLR